MLNRLYTQVWLPIFAFLFGMVIQISPHQGSGQVSADLQNIYDSASLAYQDGFYEDVLEWIRPVLEGMERFDPNQPAVSQSVILYAKACLQTQQEALAIQMLQRLPMPVAAEPMAIEYFQCSANALVRIGDLSNALAAMENYFRVSGPSHPSVGMVENYLVALLKLGKLAQLEKWFHESQNQEILQSIRLSDPVIAVDLLLIRSEGLFMARQFSDLNDVLAVVMESRLSPGQLWKARFLQTAAGIESSTKGLNAEELKKLRALRPLAIASGDTEALWKTALLESKAWLIQEDFTATRSSLTTILQKNVPLDIRGEALLRMAQTFLKQGQFTEARDWLDRVSSSDSSKPIQGWVWLTMAQIYFKEFETYKEQGMKADARLALDNARQKFEEVINLIPGSHLGSYARFHLGWCLLEDGQIIPALEEFEAAYSLFPPGGHQLESLLKVGELYLQTSQFEESRKAFAQIRELMDRYAYGDRELRGRVNLARIKACLMTEALDEAGTIVEEMTIKDPDLEATVHAVLAYSQYLTNHGQALKAQDLLSRIVPGIHTPYLRGIVEENLIYTLICQESWISARQSAETWVLNNPDHPHLADVLYQLGFLTLQTSGPDGAFPRYQRFVSQFPTHPKAPSTQFWVAQHLFNLGEYEKASQAFLILINTPAWNDPRLKFEAERQKAMCLIEMRQYDDARIQLRNLISRLESHIPNHPGFLEIHGNCWLSLVDSYLRQPESGVVPQQALSTLEDFFKAWPNHPMVSELNNYAGRLLLRGYSRSPEFVARAEKFFTKTLDSDASSPSLRAEAQFGLANILELRATNVEADEKSALLKQAADIYRKIFYQSPDLVHPFWIKKAGLSATRIMIELNESIPAQKLKSRFLTLFPSESQSIEGVIQALQ
ncbi:MAG: tetratricopeptide repeat protein [Verrucomicrobia bacterium]|nr:tetratricopeptide repeat protein [Verrucomicrobiota bacterium]